MGNAPGSFRLLGNGTSSYHFQLGQLASISMKKGEEKWEDNGKRSQKWEVSYNVEGLTCTLSITKSTGINSDEELRIDIEDNTCREKINRHAIKQYSSGFTQIVGRAEAGLLVGNMICFHANSTKDVRGWEEAASSTYVPYTRASSTYVPYTRASSTYVPYTRNTTNSSGGVTSTTICPYRSSGTRKGLYVTEWKKKKENEKPYMVTIAHYYANNGENLFTRGIDVGLSMMVKIRVSNGALFGIDEFDFTVDGPVQHPSSALLYMIEEVTRTGMWTPRACPHCANIQRQRRWQSESDDSDNLPVAPGHGHGNSQNARNHGVFNGDGNGSNYERNIMLFINKFCT
ncbi:hypothetical protein JHK85_001852 [Glycine max]|nr:uncharacterized protein LOC114417906 isoform X2 [Glycine soja]XP_028238791.1 uncharacterized protein LOC114417906 isoform X2 [Glycine soja]XP_028238799.1 uncharacterized protein LOC114417906 isoform X2 [Glycine soja]KAG5069475.1 hypothetical protein JHK85_001852 [Glycine max]KAH1163097.1 hypothetical protein GYH30_001578 [Glycine max]RZC29983.1 hypothetical protein D0Y65_001552 [Glycine soja]